MKKAVIAIIVLGIIIGGWYWVKNKDSYVSPTTQTDEADNLAADLNAVSDANLDAELQPIDQDAEQL